METGKSSTPKALPLHTQINAGNAGGTIDSSSQHTFDYYGAYLGH